MDILSVEQQKGTNTIDNAYSDSALLVLNGVAIIPFSESQPTIWI